MILIEPMKYALEFIKMFNGLSENQLSFFMEKKFSNRNPARDVDRLLRMKLIIKQNNAIYIPNMAVKPDIQEAVEIACHFWNKNTISLSNEQHPILLKLVKLFKGNAHAFLICKAEDVSDLRVDNENSTVIVISDFNYKYKIENIIKSRCSALNCGFLIAVKEYGKYYYYKIRKEFL